MGFEITQNNKSLFNVDQSFLSDLARWPRPRPLNIFCDDLRDGLMYAQDLAGHWQTKVLNICATTPETLHVELAGVTSQIVVSTNAICDEGGGVRWVIPPLRRRPELALGLFQLFYGRFFVCDAGFLEELKNCCWGGGLAQLRGIANYLAKKPGNPTRESFKEAIEAAPSWVDFDYAWHRLELEKTFSALAQQHGLTCLSLEVEKRLIDGAIRRRSGCVSAVARLFGLRPTTLFSKLEKFKRAAGL